MISCCSEGCVGRGVRSSFHECGYGVGKTGAAMLCRLCEPQEWRVQRKSCFFPDRMKGKEACDETGRQSRK